jgi:hypothetical protein
LSAGLVVGKSVTVGVLVVVGNGSVVVVDGVLVVDVAVGDAMTVWVTVDVTVTGAGFGHEQVTRIDCVVAPSVIVGFAVHEPVPGLVAAYATPPPAAIARAAPATASLWRPFMTPAW